MRSSSSVNRRTAAVVFDLFGTLLDVGTLRTAVSEYTDEPDPFVDIWRQKQIAYAFAATSMRCYADFDSLTMHALRYAAQSRDVALSEASFERLAGAWRTMGAFPDARPCLEVLHEVGLRSIVLTNATRQTSIDAVRHAALDDLIDAIYTVDDVGAYKPAPAAYGAILATNGSTADEFVFVTSNGWDAVGAAEFGMRVAWCNRTKAPVETFGKPPAWHVASLSQVAEAVIADASSRH